MKDILLNKDNELVFRNGDFDIGESEMQEVAAILQSTQGEWKETPLLGPNLYRFIHGKIDKIGIEREVQIHLALDNKDFKTLKTKIETQIKNE
ncbi:hypothetical protein [Elizabethkingia anophelis]|uniref:hypothetical protein n=1 Tax=Elizabethkingia anophelis TaxID=1117645 RepID=UPI00320817AC